MTDERMLTTAEVAARLGISRQLAWLYLREGLIPGAVRYRPNGNFHVPESDVERFMARARPPERDA